MPIFENSPTQVNPSSARLEQPPDLPGPPPGIPARPGLLGLAGGGPGVGGSPQQLAVTGLAMMEQGSKLLTAVLPGMSPIIIETMTGLKDAVPRALAELTQAGSSLPAGSDAMMPYAPGMGGGTGPGANAGIRPPGPMTSLAA
jgi:hypothetical protein